MSADESLVEKIHQLLKDAHKLATKAEVNLVAVCEHADRKTYFSGCRVDQECDDVFRALGILSSPETGVHELTMVRHYVDGRIAAKLAELPKHPNHKKGLH